MRGGELKAEEVLEAAIERVEALNPALNAVVTRLYDQARAAVAAGLPAGPFTGVPYALKDLGALYTGAVTSYGSRLFAGAVADHDSEYTVRLKRAGLVILAKTNTPEMGLAPSTEPRLFGPTRNPVEPCAQRGRLQRWRGGGGGRGHAAHGPRHRRRRIHPHPGLVLRAVRAQAHPRPQSHGTRRGGGLGRRLGRAMR